VARNVRAFGVDCDLASDENSLVKTRYVDEKTNHMLFRLDTSQGVKKRFNIDDIDFSEYQAVLISLDGRDKDCFLNQKDIEDICNRHGNVFMDSKSKIFRPIPMNLRFLKLNQKELNLNKYLKPYVFSEGQNKLKEKIIVTYGKDGCLYNGKKYPSPNPQISRDLSGAGDTFLSALAVALTRDGKNISESIEYANECAGIVVTKRGVATV
jgi:bifunctional ADP-heptose synthase (sugar kinase/adenylyltransferase)